MTRLTKDDILKLARLARLRLEDNEIDRFAREISAILAYVEQLQSVDVKGLKPTSQVTGLKNVMRPDVLTKEGPSAKELLRNVPATEDGHIKVRRMI